MPEYRESYVFYLGTDEPAVFWTGHTDLILPDDGVLDVPTLALGAGELVNLPDIEGLINGAAQRMEVTLSGVDSDTVALAAEEAAQVPGAAAYIGRIEFDADWQMIGTVTWEWSGVGEKLSINSNGEGDQRRRTISLSVAAGETTRNRSPFAFFTDADQRRDFPDDDFFTHVAGINAGTSRRWGPS